MNYPDERIVKFLKKHHVLTLATFNENNIWTSHCFYVYDKSINSLIFLSDTKTTHIKHILLNNKVSGGISLETKIVGKIQGIQLNGTVEEANNEALNIAKKKYLKRFPFAIFIDTKVWILKLEYIKMTDNILGFGKKLIWEI